MATRVEKLSPPSVDDVFAGAARSVIELLDDERSQPGGEWSDAVSSWNSARIRKIMRRGRASAWVRAQDVPGVTVAVGTAEVRAFVPGPVDQTPHDLARLQIQTTPLDEPVEIQAAPELGSNELVIAVTPDVDMSWGKLAAQCAHAGQRAWERGDRSAREQWRASGSMIRIVHPDSALWRHLQADTSRKISTIRDGGFTEIPPGTNTTIAWWA